ncbi:ATP-binding cassette domain-containing protein [Achromobacter xylosoxidans]
MLHVENMTVRFGGLTAVSDLSFQVRQGEIFTMMGPNGAGKTTAFNAITGFVRPERRKGLVQGPVPAEPLAR